MSPAAIKELEIVAGSTTLIYLFVIVVLRVFGKHPMAQLGPMDLIILMFLGSSVETSMVHGSSLLRYGFLSATVLFLLNRALALAIIKSKLLKNVFGGGPMVLISQGHFVMEHLNRAGLTQSDVMEALREREFGDLKDIQLAVLEPDGDVNVIAVSDSEKDKEEEKS
jgi:uncharacterized membrane protein YcaP (DUF421 family)